MRTLSVIATTLLLCSTLFASQTDPLWEKYINARMKYQDDVATLLAETHSELKELIAINHDLQVAMIQIRQRQYYYQLEVNPSAIIRDQGISKWADFHWAEEHEKALAEKDPKYAALIHIKDGLHKKNQGHPDWPAYRKAFMEVGKSQRYQSIHKAFIDVRTEINEKLKEADSRQGGPIEQPTDIDPQGT